VLAQTSTSIENAALFVEMLSLPNDGRYPTLELAPQQRRQNTLEAFTKQLAALSHSDPVLMIFEDAHWIDPTSLELLGRIVDKVPTLRVLLIVTHRPEFEPPWVGRPYVTTVTINRLGQREIATMIDKVIGKKTLPANIIHDIIERTDGIPLFVEEMTKAVLEAESEGDAQRTAAAVPSSGLAVPASLHASLMARLDRLGPAKEVAQIGAVIGRDFSHALLARVARKPEAELNSWLERLIMAGLLFRQGVPPHATYLFKHALVQDAAYGTLLREPRHALHARIADTIESQFPEISQNRPELLARHYTEAGLIEKAARLWSKAGQRSLGRSAMAEALEQLARALGQIATLPATPALRREQIKLQIAHANALIHTKGYAAAETKASFDQARLLIERAEALDESPEDPLSLFSVLYGFWGASFIAFDGDLCLQLAAQFLALAEKQGATAPHMIGHRMIGCSLLYTGQLIEGRAHLDRAIALYDPAQHRDLATRFSQDVRVAALSWRALARWLLGYPDRAYADVDQALSNAREIGQGATLIYALIITSITALHCGNYRAANAQLKEGVALADEKTVVFFKLGGTWLQGCVLALTGEASNAVKVITTAQTRWRAEGASIFAPFRTSNLAWAYTELGQFDQAQRSIGEAIDTTQTTKETWFEAEANRIAGEIALRSPKPDATKAQAYFERALSVARAQQAKSWELRAAMSLARLWRDQGKVQQARELLAPVYGWFTEGFDTRDLKEAKALLEELAA
jgi:predicted ATPase